MKLPYYEDPQTTRVNTEEDRAYYVPYSSAERPWPDRAKTPTAWSF